MKFNIITTGCLAVMLSAHQIEMLFITVTMQL